MTYTFRCTGELREGAVKENVVKSLSRLFKTSPEKIGRLFDQQHEFVLTDLSKEVASDYRNAFSRAGAVGYITSTDASLTLKLSATFLFIKLIKDKARQQNG